MVAAWEEAAMTALVHDLQFDPALLAYLEDNEVRYEVLDGSIVVSPPPGFQHEDLVIPLGAQLLAAAPADVAVLGSGYRFYYEPSGFVMADITVAARKDCKEHGIEVAPLLLVEIFSPSSRKRDRRDKREIYESAGVPSYWLVDPVKPSLTVLTLTNCRYVETAHIIGSEQLHASEPFPVTIRLRH